MSKDFSEESNPENKSISILKCVVTLRKMSWKDENFYSNRVLKIYLTFMPFTSVTCTSVRSWDYIEDAPRETSIRGSVLLATLKSGHGILRTTFTWSKKGKSILHFSSGYFTSLAQKLVRMRPAQNARLHRMVFLSTPHLLQRLNSLIIESFAELE